MEMGWVSTYSAGPRSRVDRLESAANIAELRFARPARTPFDKLRAGFVPRWPVVVLM
jgi:hypothetical protein